MRAFNVGWNGLSQIALNKGPQPIFVRSKRSSSPYRSDLATPHFSRSQRFTLDRMVVLRRSGESGEWVSFLAFDRAENSSSN